LKQKDEGMTLHFFDQEAGGNGSLGGRTASLGFLSRKVIKPTTIGMTIKTTDRHKKANPIQEGIVPMLLILLTVVVYGIFPVAAQAPKMHRKSPGHPHRRIAATVPMMAPVFDFFVSITFSFVE
jgi:hypothetical protein